MKKGISIYYSPDDLRELHEFIQWKTNKAAGKFASVESEFDLRTASDLIKRAAQEKQNILRQIDAERGSQDELAQVRENVSLLPDREAERIQAGWVEAAKDQASRYCQSRNNGATPKAFDPDNKEEADIRQSTLSWIKRQKMRGSFGGQKALSKN